MRNIFSIVALMCACVVIALGYMYVHGLLADIETMAGNEYRQCLVSQADPSVCDPVR